jgi:drug/metabolite transporter (DMT)-like permease
VSASSGRHPSRAVIAAAFFCIYVLWGATFLARQLALRSIPPFMESSLRFLIAGAALFAFSKARGHRFPPRREALSHAAVGFFLLFGGTGVVSWSQRLVPSGIASLFVASVPMWMVLVDWAWNRERPHGGIYAGLFLGFCGIAMLARPSAVTGGINPVGACTLLMASFSWALGSVFAKKLPAPESDAMVVSIQMLTGGTLLMLFAFAVGQTHEFSFQRLQPVSLAAMVYLVVFGSIAGFTAYQWLLKMTSPAIVATHAYVNPLIAVLLGWTVLGEPFSFRIALSGVLIIISVALIITASPRRPPETQGA